VNPILAVDLGGTQMRAAFVDRDGGILLRRVEPTPRDTSCPDALLMLVGGLLKSGDAETAVIGVPGRVHYGTGTLEYAPNLPVGWAPSLTEAKLSAILGLRVALANDADLAAVGESRFGAGRGYDDVVYITISTGIGAGVILGGVLAHGRRSLAEVGHTIIDRAPTGAGAPATLEYEGSGTALKRIAASEGFDRSGARLVELVDSGDATAIRIWDSVAQAAGIGVANLAHLFSPEVVVVGGGVAQAGDLLLGPIRAALAQLGPRGLPEPINVVRASLGDDAGLSGAAGWFEAFVREVPSDV
jgi:glucokinase